MTYQAAPAAAGEHYAGFLIRLAAYLIDCIVMGVIGYVVGLVAAAVTGAHPAAGDATPGAVNAATVIGVILGYAYMVLMAAGPWQATLGKRACGIHIITESGARPTALKMLGRELCRMLSAIIIGIGYLMVIWTKEKTALHDLIVHTRVVYGRV